MPDISLLPLPPAGEVLLGHLLTGLVDPVPGVLGATLAVVREQLPEVLAAVGAAVGAGAWLEAPVTEAARDGQPVTAVPDLGPAGSPDGAGVVAVPAGGAEPLVVALVLDRAPEPSDADSAARALPMLGSAVAVLRGWAEEAERTEQMVQMVQYRRVIEQAKGLVMGVTGTDAAAAFATLARASQHFNVRLRNLSVALVEFVGGAPAEGPDDPVAVLVPADRDRTAAQRMWAALTAGPAPLPGAAGEG